MPAPRKQHFARIPHPIRNGIREMDRRDAIVLRRRHHGWNFDFPKPFGTSKRQIASIRLRTISFAGKSAKSNFSARRTLSSLLANQSGGYIVNDDARA